MLEYCAAHLETIIYIGGDLPQDIGDIVAAKVYLRCQWGTTETGIPPQLLSPKLFPPTSLNRDLWRYVQFHPCVGAMFDEVTDGIYELVIRRDPALADTQPCFTVPGLDELEEYRTKDLFEPHPSISDAWCWRARADDIIVFLNGEKTNPISMEHHIMANNPELSGVLVIGAQRFQAALLIESASESLLTTAEQAALIERIWPSVEEANRSAPAHAQLEKSFILIVPSDRRFIRAGKGTFMRGPSISQYIEEIERLYANADFSPDDGDDGADEETLHISGLDGITHLVRQHVRTVTGWSSLDDASGFFDHGMDSLQGVRLTRALRRSFHRPGLALSTIYQNPTVSRLAAAIFTGDGDEQDEYQVMENLLATYQGLIQQIPVTQGVDERPNRTSLPTNVLLTGSTGTVGTYLLHALLARNGIGRIFCLNRGEDGGKASQHKSFAAAGLDNDWDDRVVFIKADLQQSSLGLDGPTYESLRAQVGIVIHAAWPVNFNFPLAAFRPQLDGLVSLLTFATSSGARFVFISSVAAVEGYTRGPPPEEVLNDLDTPAPLGYGRAKFLAERLVDTAARHLGNAMPATIIRLGQVAGPVEGPGLWNPREWLPSMVLSSLHLGQVPDSLGPHFSNVDFVPVDLLSNVLVELATATTEVGQVTSSATVFNIRNPHLTPWRTLLPAITDAVAGQQHSSGRLPLQVVAPASWLARLRASNDTESYHDVAVRNPAIKLLDFFDNLWGAEAGTEPTPVPMKPMAVEHAVEASPALRRLEPVQLDWMHKWVMEWVSLREE